MFTQPFTHPFASPAARLRDRHDVADHARTMAGVVGPYLPRLIALTDGRVYNALALPAGHNLTLAWPQTMHMAHPGLPPVSVTVNWRAPAGARINDRRTPLTPEFVDLEDITLQYPLTDLGPDPTTPAKRLMAQAAFVGFTRAVPFAVHDTGSEWLCMGGVFSQNRGGQDVEFTLPRQTFGRQSSGMIGFRMQLERHTDAAGAGEGGAVIVNQAWITSIDWEFQALGDQGINGPDSIFVPGWVVNAASGRIANLGGLQTPVDPKARTVNFNPGGATGILPA